MFPDWGIPCFILNSEWNSKLIKIRLLTPRVQGYVFERLWCVTCYLNSLSLTETSLVQKATFTIFCRSSSLLSLLTGLLNWETTVLNCKTEVWEVFYLLNNIFSQLGKGLIQETMFFFFFLSFPLIGLQRTFHMPDTQQDACRSYDTVEDDYISQFHIAFNFLYSLQVGYFVKHTWSFLLVEFHDVNTPNQFYIDIWINLGLLTELSSGPSHTSHCLRICHWEPDHA